MTSRLLKFVVIWWLVILCFTCVGMLLFPYTKKFDTSNHAIYYMLCASIGNWDATVFDLGNQNFFAQYNFNDNDVLMGQIFLLIFMLFNLIVLLNLVIAILAGTYSELC